MNLVQLYRDYLETQSQAAWDKFSLAYNNASEECCQLFDEIQSQVKPRSFQAQGNQKLVRPIL